MNRRGVRAPLPPDSVAVADGAADWRSAYIHIPFCRRRCPYCDFAVVAHDEIASDPQPVIDEYVDALVAEIDMEPLWEPLDAVNFGGGTPSSLPVRQLERILAALAARFGVSADAEISIEANPEDVTDAVADAYAAAGFTRVSLGIQSFDDRVLGVLGRRHDGVQAAAAVSALRRAEIASVSIDLIFGAAGETLTSWQHTIDAAVDLGPDHLSAYALTVESGTQLWREVRRGGAAPDPDHQADEYEALQKATGQVGLVHYEVSNWARPGHVCRYNLGTWAQGEYAGFGLGAHGHRGGVRRRNVRQLEAYLHRIDGRQRPEAGAETQSDFSREQERLMLGLRRRAGVPAGRIGAALAASDEGVRLIQAGIVEFVAGRIRVLQPLLTDAVARSVLSLSPGDC